MSRQQGNCIRLHRWTSPDAGQCRIASSPSSRTSGESRADSGPSRHTAQQNHIKRSSDPDVKPDPLAIIDSMGKPPPKSNAIRAPSIRRYFHSNMRSDGADGHLLTVVGAAGGLTLGSLPDFAVAVCLIQLNLTHTSSLFRWWLLLRLSFFNSSHRPFVCFTC